MEGSFMFVCVCVCVFLSIKTSKLRMLFNYRNAVADYIEQREYSSEMCASHFSIKFRMWQRSMLWKCLLCVARSVYARSVPDLLVNTCTHRPRNQLFYYHLNSQVVYRIEESERNRRNTIEYKLLNKFLVCAYQILILNMQEPISSFIHTAQHSTTL